MIRLILFVFLAAFASPAADDSVACNQVLKRLLPKGMVSEGYAGPKDSQPKTEAELRAKAAMAWVPGEVLATKNVPSKGWTRDWLSFVQIGENTKGQERYLALIYSGGRVCGATVLRKEAD